MKKEITEKYIRQLVSKNLRRIRKLQSKSQFGLAGEADLSHNFLNDVESCKKGISFDTIAKLSTALEVEPFQFFLPDDISNINQAYMNILSESVQRAVRDAIALYIALDEK